MHNPKSKALEEILGFLDKKQGESLKKHSPKFAALRVDIHHGAPPEEGSPAEELAEPPAEAMAEGDDDAKLLALAKKRGR